MVDYNSIHTVEDAKLAGVTTEDLFVELRRRASEIAGLEVYDKVLDTARKEFKRLSEGEWIQKQFRVLFLEKLADLVETDIEKAISTNELEEKVHSECRAQFERAVVKLVENRLDRAISEVRARFLEQK